MPMNTPNHALTLQLLEWLSTGDHTYAEVLETWHSTCPRLTIWEDACADGLIAYEPGRRFVTASAKGRRLLEASLTS
jgi:hypothetical protein